MSLLSLVHTKKSNLNSIKKAISKSINLINFHFKKNPEKVIIKPNMCYYFDPSTGQVTDPNFVSAIIDIFREFFSSNIEISIVESDASAMKCKYAFRMLGYDKIANDKKVKLVNLSNEKSKKIELIISDKIYKLNIPYIFQECDLLINVPKMKYMDIVKFSCALKNIFGCNAYQKKSIYHNVLNEVIVNMNKIIKSDLVIVDGIIVNGLSTRRLGLVMTSRDPVAIDAAASKIVGLNPKSVKYITLASKEGLGNPRYIAMGENLNYFKELFPKRNKMDLRRLIGSILRVNF